MQSIIAALKDNWSIATTIFGAAWALWERSKKKKAEAKLELIRRRADSPFFSPSDQRFDRVCFSGDAPHEIRFWPVDKSHVLCFYREEVDANCAKGDAVVLVVDISRDARKVNVKLDGEPIQIDKEPEMDFTRGLFFLRYPFDPAKRGKEQHIKISFETETGHQDTHTYLTEHGRRKLIRIDPP